MSLNRVPFNALVDDNGTGAVGTPWNKQAIKDVILDPVDALVRTATWAAVPFNVANFWPGVAASHVLVNYSKVICNTLIWIVQVYNPPVPAGGGAYLPFLLPGGRTILGGNAIMGPTAFAADNAVPVAAFLIPAADTQHLAVAKTNFAGWAGPNCSAYFTAIVGLA